MGEMAVDWIARSSRDADDSGTVSREPRDPRRLDDVFESLYAEALGRRGGEPLRLREWVDLAESWRIMRALRECRGNRSAAARALGIGRRTLYTKMEKLGISSVWDVFRSS